jgi:hypothetical protein
VVLARREGRRLRRVPGVEHEHRVAGVARVAPDREAERLLGVGGDPVLGVLAVDEAHRVQRGHGLGRVARGGDSIERAAQVVRLQVRPPEGVGVVTGLARRHHRVEQPLGERRRGVVELGLPAVLDGERVRFVGGVVHASVVDERRVRDAVVAAEGLAAIGLQDADALVVRDLGEHGVLVDAAGLEADHDDS